MSPNRLAEETISWRRAARDVVLLLLLCHLCFVNTYHLPFVDYDDERGIRQNPHVHGLSLANVGRAAFSLPRPGEWPYAYLPVRDLSLAMDYSFWMWRQGSTGKLEGVASQLHQTNVLLHAVNTVLVYGVLTVLGLDAVTALLAAALFACHPLHAEAVTWVSGRKDVLAGALILSSFLFYCRGRQGGKVWRLASMALFSLATLAKATALVLPGLLILYDLLLEGPGEKGARLPLGKRVKNCWKLWMPFLAIAGLAFLLHGFVALRMATIHPGDVSRQPGGILSFVPTVAHYLWKFLFPLHLRVRYAGSGIGVASVLAWMGLLALWGFTWRERASSRGISLFLWGWCFLTLLPVLNWVTTSIWAADRYFYLPSLGACALLALALKRLLPSGLIFRAAVLVTFGSLTALTVRQNIVWSDSARLWKNAVRGSPDDPVAQYNLALNYMLQGADSRAIPLLEKVDGSLPGSVDVWNNLGLAFLQAGKSGRAEELFRRILDRDGGDVEARLNMGFVYCQRGEFEAADKIFNGLPERWRNSRTIHRGLAKVAASRKLYPEALAHLDRAIESDPACYEAHREGVLVAMASLDFSRAIRHCQAIVRLRPRDASGWDQLARLYGSMGQHEDALGAYGEVILLQPNFADHHYRMGHVLLRLGRAEEAVRRWQRVLELQPDHQGAREGLDQLGRAGSERR